MSGSETSSPVRAGGAIRLRDGRTLRLRPILPDDESALVEMVERSTPEDVRFRFLSPVHPRVGPLSARLTHFDPARHIAVAAYDPKSPRGDREILGVVRLVLEGDDHMGEFAVMVRSDLKGQGLGSGLMREMLRWSDELGLDGVDGEILSENRPMRRLVQTLGGRTLPSNGYYRNVRVRFDLPFASAPPISGRLSEDGVPTPPS